MGAGPRSPNTEACAPADDPDAEWSNDETDPDDLNDRINVAQDALFQTREELVLTALKQVSHSLRSVLEDPYYLISSLT